MNSTNLKIDNSSSDKRFDDKFIEIEGMTWLPWVGKKYYKAGCKILIVAESHYTNGDKPDAVEHSKTELMNDATLTRQVVQECPINRDWGNNMFDNLHRALVGTNDFDATSLWENIAFFNHVQRPMDYNIKERPNFADYMQGWKVFSEVVQVLKPDYCIYVGVEASNSFNYAMDCENIIHSKVEWLSDYQGAYARRMNIEFEDYVLPIHAIRHTSSYFTWEFWNAFLKKYTRQAIEYLSALYSGQIFETEYNIESYIPDATWTSDIPTWLTHKPIIACNYSRIEDDSDVVYITVGRATYASDTDASVKIWRHNGNRWKRSSEEIPITRLPDALLMLLTTIKSIQEGTSSIDLSYLHEAFVAKDDMDFLASCLSKNGGHLRESLSEVRRILNTIDLDKI